MVAVPGLSGARTQAFPLLGGSGTVSMEASLRLRAKDYAAHDRWLVNLQDVITSNRLDDLWENQQVPTLEAALIALAARRLRRARPSPFSARACALLDTCLLYTSPSPRDATLSRMPSSA